jgi:hypothetical protein
MLDDPLPSNFKTLAAGSQNVQKPLGAQSAAQVPNDWRCFSSGERGHYANQCLNPHPCSNQTSTTNPTPNRGAYSAPVASR